MAYRARNRRNLAVPSKIELSVNALLRDEMPGPEGNKFVIHMFSFERARAAWARFGKQIMQDWPNKNTRPHCWYLFESPKLPPFCNPEWPNHWAAYPEKVPSEKVQRAFLDSLKK